VQTSSGSLASNNAVKTCSSEIVIQRSYFSNVHVFVKIIQYLKCYCKITVENTVYYKLSPFELVSCPSNIYLFAFLIGSCPVTHMSCLVCLACARNKQYESDKIKPVHLMCMITVKLFYVCSF
jgi:hypothetical protein